MTIGIFLPYGLGDLVMATPMLRALRRHVGPETRLVGITRPQLIPVLQGTHWLDEQWALDPQSHTRTSRDWTLVRRIHRERFDTVLFLPQSFRATVLAWLGGARRRVGYVRHGGGKLLTDRLSWPHRLPAASRYSLVDHYYRLAQAIGCPIDSTQLELATTERDQRRAEDAWKTLGIRADGRVVALNPTGAGGTAALWPAAYFAQLARRLAVEADHDVVVLCGARQRQIANDIARQAGHPRVFSLADQHCDLGTQKAVIRRVRLLVSNQSGMRLVAAAFQKPVIGLFGPRLPGWDNLPEANSASLSAGLDCIGCQNRVCPLRHHRCMKDLSVETVFGRAAQMLQENLAACAAA